MALCAGGLPAGSAISSATSRARRCGGGNRASAWSRTPVHPSGKVIVTGEVFRADAQPARHLPALHYGRCGLGRSHQAS
jgi:hypothetical protein